jgi:hypothetical protein
LHTTGYGNIVIGTCAESILTTGSNNVIIGNFSGYQTSSESYNTIVGAGATIQDGASNASAIGAGAYALLSNVMALGGVQGSGYEVKVGIGTSNPSCELEVIGTIKATGLSLNLGSGATGDIYYQDSSGNLHRLPIGTSGQTLKVVSGLPAWV